MKVTGYFSYFGTLVDVGLDYGTGAAGSPHQRRRRAGASDFATKGSQTPAPGWGFKDGTDEGSDHDAWTCSQKSPQAIFGSRGESTVVSLLR